MAPSSSAVAAAVAVLLAVVTASAASSPGAQVADKPRRLLPDHILESLLDQRVLGEDDEYTKLERMLRNALLTLRDGLAKPQPDLGLPCLDPFDTTESMPIAIHNEFASINAVLVSAHSQGISKFNVDKLAVYLVERVGVLDLTLPDFTIDFVLDVPEGSWISPLKLPLNDQFNVRFSSPKIVLNMRDKISVKDGRLSMNSTHFNLDLGDWEFQILEQRSTPSTCADNDGLCPLLASVVRSVAPWLVQEWLPVAEKLVTAQLDAALQKLQISDLIPDEAA